MPILFDPVTILVIAGFVAAGYLIWINLRHPKSSSTPIDDNLQKSYQLIHSAIKKAQAILSSAELEAIKVVSDSKFELKHTLEQQEGTISTEFNQYLQSLKADLQKIHQEYSQYLQYLKEQADREKSEGQDSLRQQVEEMFIRFEEKLADFLTQTQARSVETIDLELKATRQLIETYKQQQLKVIDENIVAMLERTLALVLAKKLSLQDQVDLIYESLEKAKQEKFIV